MRRRAGVNETDLIEIRQFEHFLRETQMSIMNRVECSTQDANRDADRFFSHRMQRRQIQLRGLQCKPAGIRQHLREENDKTHRCRAIDHAMVVRQ